MPAPRKWAPMSIQSALTAGPMSAPRRGDLADFRPSKRTHPAGGLTLLIRGLFCPGFVYISVFVLCMGVSPPSIWV